ncbi:hypothetical protein A3Q56_02721 [Intoshia linei]|uniref:Uncharacterized protein n=1 Tax=Intoshia linei TaxID=1819745 RepID=A0A177B5I0_9BILA|nr:hypothetical protein A3Q56_02721 [Intoshia linei]
MKEISNPVLMNTCKIALEFRLFKYLRDPLYICATFLDPRYKTDALNKSGIEYDLCVEAIQKMISQNQITSTTTTIQ